MSSIQFRRLTDPERFADDRVAGATHEQFERTARQAL
jgi:hypothetical protein